MGVRYLRSAEHHPTTSALTSSCRPTTSYPSTSLLDLATVLLGLLLYRHRITRDNNSSDAVRSDRVATAGMLALFLSTLERPFQPLVMDRIR